MSAPSPPRPGRGLSPCVSVCTLEPGQRWCLGCFRTVEEIAQWSSLDDATRLAIMAVLPGRRARLAPPGGAC